MSSTKLYVAVHKSPIYLRSHTARVAVRRANGASRPRHVLQIVVFHNTMPVRGAGVPHGDQPGALLSVSRPYNAYNDHLFPGKQSAYLADRCHIYMLPNGRINIGSLNRNNLDRFAQAVHEAITNNPDQETSTQLNAA